MRRVSVSFLCRAAVLALLASPTMAGAQAPADDPIGDALANEPGLPDQTGGLSDEGGNAPPRDDRPRAREFSPSAISDLLKQQSGEAPGPSDQLPRAQSPKHLPEDPAAKLTKARAPLSPEAINALRFGRISDSSKGIDPLVLKAEVLLDRAHAPPGVIDGRHGANFVKAINTFETVRGLPVDGKLTRRVWDELGGDTAESVLGIYTIKPEDVVGPFYPDMSPDYAEQAKMPDLGYRTPLEMFSERFHMDEKFLKALNPGVDMSVAGSRIVVTEVAALPIASEIARIDVDKGKGQVLAYDPDGMLIVAYPATIGSEELPSPTGSYVVRGIAPHPTYTYDPKKNFQQGKNTQKLILPSGPNNPVGAAFVALSKPTFGIHGTPDPSKIDKTHSHGCVRLTNWNAQELAGLVKVGVPVNFIDRPGAETPSEPDIESVLNMSQPPQ